MLAAAADPSLNDLLGYANSATVLGVLVLIIYSGRKQWWVWGSVLERSEQRSKEELDREMQRAERAETDRDRLQSAYQDQVIPFLKDSIHANTEARTSLSDLARQVAELRGQLK